LRGEAKIAQITGHGNHAESKLQRIDLLRDWLTAELDRDDFRLSPASEDASFRRYFRVEPPGRPSLIVMDAPPAHEDCRPFVHVARLFQAAGVHVPEVIAEDLEQGFLLLSDLGSTTYLAALRDPGINADVLYREALTSLVRIQAASRPGELPGYDRALLERELRLFPDWYVAKQLAVELSVDQRNALERSFELLLAENLAQPRVYVHRDYHSRNLMVTTPNPGILDFQDAVHGPITYDLVSLLRDAYIEWPEQRQLDWAIRYWEAARSAQLPVHADFSDFYRSFEWMGAQRQIKVLGIFARLWKRDGKEGYLKDQPLVMRYLKRTCRRYHELGPLAKLLDELDPEDRATVVTTF